MCVSLIMREIKESVRKRRTKHRVNLPNVAEEERWAEVPLNVRLLVGFDLTRKDVIHLKNYPPLAE